jgi:hypothetical protein
MTIRKSGVFFLAKFPHLALFAAFSALDSGTPIAPYSVNILKFFRSWDRRVRPFGEFFNV